EDDLEDFNPTIA
uniref:Venom peptide Sa10 n=1 Tax=Sphex argentatus argentatus TaxID=2838366 RepID=VP10_SPHAA|nr:RecName: Full=Venom peptide Sa10 [Sphex argentatus argentatus]